MSREAEERIVKLVVIVRSKTHSTADLTAMLCLVPDESWEIGTPFQFGRGTKLRDTSSWAVEERAVGNEDCYTAADRLVARLHAFVPQFQALPAEVKVSLRILVNENNNVFGLSLDRPHVKFAGEIGATIDVSVRVQMSIEQLEADLNAAKSMKSP
jgi:hypothetical protein